MRRIIDYAGLFPPSSLPLDAALREFHAYQHHPRSDFLGRFVMPLDWLNKLTSESGESSKFTGLLRPGTAPMADARAAIERQAAGLRQFGRHFPRIAMDSIEADLPADAWTAEGGYGCLRGFLALLENAFGPDRRIFIELNWRKPYVPLMAVIAERGYPFGLKLRTGGVSPDAVPPSRTVAQFLLASAAHKLPVKATAGLHVPVPNQNPEVGARMHGFLNFFCAGFLAFTGRGDEDALTDVLENCGYADFSFGPHAMRCGDLELEAGEIERLRAQWLLSFGSCSFLEPIEHLERHGLL